MLIGTGGIQKIKSIKLSLVCYSVICEHVVEHEAADWTECFVGEKKM